METVSADLLKAIAMADTDDTLVRKLALGAVLALVTASAVRSEREATPPKLHLVRSEP